LQHYQLVPQGKNIFHLGYWHDGNGWVGVTMCLKAQTQVIALLVNYGRIVPQPLDDMFGLTPNGSIQNVAIETSNLLVEGEFVSMSKMEGVQISIPPENILINPQ